MKRLIVAASLFSLMTACGTNQQASNQDNSSTQSLFDDVERDRETKAQTKLGEGIQATTAEMKKACGEWSSVYTTPIFCTTFGNLGEGIEQAGIVIPQETYKAFKATLVGAANSWDDTSDLEGVSRIAYLPIKGSEKILVATVSGAGAIVDGTIVSLAVMSNQTLGSFGDMFKAIQNKVVDAIDDDSERKNLRNLLAKSAGLPFGAAYMVTKGGEKVVNLVANSSRILVKLAKDGTIKTLELISTSAKVVIKFINGKIKKVISSFRSKTAQENHDSAFDALSDEYED